MENHDYIIGKNPVLEALRSEQDINKIWIAEGSERGQMQQVVNLAKEANVLVQFVPKKKIRSNGRGKSSRCCCTSRSLSIC